MKRIRSVASASAFTGRAWVLVFLIFGASSSYAEVNAWPVLELNEDSTTVLYPLHVREEGFKMNFPFYYEANDGKDTHLLWPMVKISDGELKRAVPFWFKEDEGEDFVFFPFYLRSGDKKFWLVPPMYLSDHLDLVFPFYFDNKSSGANKRQTHLLTWYRYESDDGNSTGVWPFYGKSRKKVYHYKFPDGASEGLEEVSYIEEKRYTLWPLISRTRKEDLDGNLVSEQRRFIVFSDSQDAGKQRKFSLFDFLIKERI